MKKGLLASIAAFLIVVAGWITQDGCTDNSIDCHVGYFLKFTDAISNIIANAPSVPL